MDLGGFKFAITFVITVCHLSSPSLLPLMIQERKPCFGLLRERSFGCTNKEGNSVQNNYVWLIMIEIVLLGYIWKIIKFCGYFYKFSQISGKFCRHQSNYCYILRWHQLGLSCISWLVIDGLSWGDIKFLLAIEVLWLLSYNCCGKKVVTDTT